VKLRPGQIVRILLLSIVFAPVGVRSMAAPYAAMVMDMRSGEVIHARNADTQLHPASLTKMMTLYVAFQAIEHGEISLDTMVTISANAASEPPSKLGLRTGQKIKLRYLIRAAAVRSANDAATAIGEAIAGSEAAYAERMTRTAKALGMNRTQFKNMHGLTQAGHMSTARDMTILGRHVFFDYSEYYNLFSRRSADAGVAQVPNTNRRFLDAYKGADGIKTGYTRAAGFNLVASAERGGKRIIATVFGGQSTASRNQKVAQLLDLGFRKVPTRVALRPTSKPAYTGPGGGAAIVVAADSTAPDVAGKVIRVVRAPNRSIRPMPRPVPAVPDEALVAAIGAEIEGVISTVVSAKSPELEATEPVVAAAATQKPEPEIAAEVVAATALAPRTAPVPAPRPAEIILAAVEPDPQAEPERPEVITRLSSAGGRHWAINVGRYTSEYEAERILLKTALVELSTLGEALRKVARSARGYEANFVGLTEEGADLACRRLSARNTTCEVIGPS
jgi:D-alanyl-D-alanine carboxypeptidase